MKYLAWFFRIIVFTCLLLLSFSNTQVVTFYLTGQYSWQAPLIVIGLFFFILGTIIGLLSALKTIAKQRKEISKLKREAIALQRNNIEPETQAPIIPFI